MMARVMGMRGRIVEGGVACVDVLHSLIADALMLIDLLFLAWRCRVVIDCWTACATSNLDWSHATCCVPERARDRGRSSCVVPYATPGVFSSPGIRVSTAHALATRPCGTHKAPPGTIDD